MIGRLTVLVIVTATSLSVPSLPAQSLTSEEGLLESLVKGELGREVPDEYLVRSECGFWKDAARRYARDHEGTIDKVCSAYASGKIDGDQWLILFDPLARAVAWARDLVLCANCVPLALKPRQPVPAGYLTYSVFLIPSADWKVKDAEVRALFRAFDAFGDAIGNKRAAVWFTDRGRENAVDIDRSKVYCDRLKLSYNDGPYVITSQKRPHEIAAGDEVVVIRLAGIEASRVVRVLNVLEQDLRTGAGIRKRPLLFEEIKQRLLSVYDRRPELLKDVAGLVKLKKLQGATKSKP